MPADPGPESSVTGDDDRRAEIEAYEWSLTMALPDATPNDPYDPDEFAEALHEVADRIADEEMPPTGDLWDKTGRLLGHARLDRVRDARSDDVLPRLVVDWTEDGHGIVLDTSTYPTRVVGTHSEPAPVDRVRDARGDDEVRIVER